MNRKGSEYLDISLQDEKEAVEKVLRFQPKLITGGKGGIGDNWLSRLTEGTIFLVKPKASAGFALGQFHLLHKLDKACHLMDNLQTETHIWVDPKAFSSQFDLVVVLYEQQINDSSDN